MEMDGQMRRWIEYSICEYAMEAYPKSRARSSTFYKFCENIKTSLRLGTLSKWEYSTLAWITHRVNRLYHLPKKEIDTILAEFFVDRKWVKYSKAIELMKHVRFSI